MVAKSFSNHCCVCISFPSRVPKKCSRAIVIASRSWSHGERLVNCLRSDRASILEATGNVARRFCGAIGRKTRGVSQDRSQPCTLLGAGSFLASLAVFACAALLAACTGDTGAAGPPGPPGPPGPAGPPGTGGSAGAARVSPSTPCRTTPASPARSSRVTVPTGGGAPVVTFRLTNDLTQGLKGLLPADVRFTIAQLRPGTGGASSEWQSYVTKLDGSTVQANTETAAAERFVDNGDGTYQYTFAQALTAYTGAPTYNGALTHRVGLEVRNNAPTNNAPFDFVPAGGAVTTQAPDRRQRQLPGMSRRPRVSRRRALRHAVLRDLPQPLHARTASRLTSRWT